MHSAVFVQQSLYICSKLHIPANIGTAAAPGEVPSGEDGQPKEAEKME